MANRRPYKKRPYSIRSLMHEREYGFYWYSWLWSVLRPVVVFLCAAVITLGIAASGWRYIYNNTLSPIDANDPSTVTFDIPKGTSVSTIADQLVEQHLLRNKGVFKYVIMFQGLTSRIHYGSYQISPSMGVNQIIQVLTSGSASTERTITIIPGWTVPDIGAYLLRTGAIKDEQAFYDLCNDSVKFGNYYTVQQAITDKSIAGRKFVLEGYLAPNTYRVFTDATAEDLIRTLLDQTDTVLNDIYNTVSGEDVSATAVPSGEDTATTTAPSGEDTAQATPAPEQFKSTLTRDQTIILASIIEKEAGSKEDYAKVSAVFHNRLRSGMRLESDATVMYTLGISRMVLTPEELSTQTKYNTYLIDGLPVGPICNPSPDAIRAALYPDMTFIDEGYLYFCAQEPGNKLLAFSKTREEHDSAVAKYKPLWIEFDKQQASATPTPQPPTPSPTATPAPTPVKAP